MNDLEMETLVNMIIARLEAREAGAQVWLSTRDAAAYMGVSAAFLEIARHRGEGPPYTRVNRAIRYSRAELDAWLRDKKRKRKGSRR